MTRINCIPAKELSREHLIAEYRELPRVFTLARNAADRGAPLPQTTVGGYQLGTGHVKFFYNKLKWLRQRHASLVKEMKKRGYKTQIDCSRSAIDLPEEYQGAWKPTDQCMEINRSRIEERKKTMASKSAAVLSTDGRAKGKFKIFARKGDALKFAKDNPSSALIMSEKDVERLLANKTFTQKDLVDVYNAAIEQFNAHPDADGKQRTRKKFDNAKQCQFYIATIFADLGDLELANAAAPAKRERAPSRSSRGKYLGKLIVPTQDSLDKNPRRTGTAGFKAMEIVRKHPEGIRYVDYIEAGGASNHLLWDIDKGNVTLIKDEAA